MNNIKEEAKRTLEQWYKEFGYNEKHRICTNHRNFKIRIGHLIFTDKNLIREINEQGKNFIKKNDIKLADFLDAELKNDKNLILELIKINGSNLSVLKNEFKNDEEIVWLAVGNCKEIFACASERLRDNDKLVNFILNIAPKQIRHTSDRFKNNKNLVSKMIANNTSILPYIHEDLKNDLDIILLIWKDIGNYKVFSDKTAFLLNNMGENMKLNFDGVDPDLEEDVVINQMKNCFNNLILRKELNSNFNKKLPKVKV